MKKIITIAIIALTLGSCTTSNIKTPKDNISIPSLIQQLAESKRDSLVKDTNNLIIVRNFESEDYSYEYKISKNKVELIKRTNLEDKYGMLIILGMILGFFIGALLKTILD